jgi:uncharacterized protein YjbI with pentapeptide repeats
MIVSNRMHHTLKNLSNRDLRGVDMSAADLHKTPLRGTNLSGANLSGANLTECDLTDARIADANLRGADLSRAVLVNAVISTTALDGANLAAAIFGNTILARLDLSKAMGLASVVHKGPSTIGLDTLYASRCEIPIEFLSGCGIPEYLFEKIGPRVLLGPPPREAYSCFISYGSADNRFAQFLYFFLKHNGLTCWLDEDRLRPGEPLRKRIKSAIEKYDKVLLCASRSSLQSPWVKTEIQIALAKERRLKRADVLVPLDLDGCLLSSSNLFATLRKKMRRKKAADLRSWRELDPSAEPRGALRTLLEALMRRQEDDD